MLSSEFYGKKNKIYKRQLMEVYQGEYGISASCCHNMIDSMSVSNIDNGSYNIVTNINPFSNHQKHYAAVDMKL